MIRTVSLASFFMVFMLSAVCVGSVCAQVADYDGDGYSDDLETGALLADANLSGRVDGIDLAWMGREWATASIDPDFVFDLDFTRDGMIDGDDLAILAAYFSRDSAVLVMNLAELENEIAQASGGETILLATADFGMLTITDFHPAGVVTIAAAPARTARFSGVSVTNSSNLVLRELTVEPRYASGADGVHAVRIDGTNIAFEDSRINFATDISGWSAADWLARTGNGVTITGSEITFLNNDIRNVDHAINVSASDSLIANNRVVGFRGDGIRGVADHITFEYNYVANCYDVDDNHDDGFQSWSYGPGGVGTGEVVGITLCGNTIISHENRDDPLACTLQGIGLFDGFFRDWVIENNLVITGHFHGIAMYGGIDSRIVNNTIVHDQDMLNTGAPWIAVVPHKNGTPSVNTVIRNNIAHQFTGDLLDHNIELNADYTADELFMDPGNGNFRIDELSPAADTGSSLLAPVMDILQVSRPQGSGWDIGAYELVSGGS